MEVPAETHTTPPRVFHLVIQPGLTGKLNVKFHIRMCVQENAHAFMLTPKERKETIYTTRSRAAKKTVAESEEFLKIFMVILKLLLVG